jgi:hypothetical protein
MRFDIKNPAGARPPQDAIKSSEVARAAAVYASKQTAPSTNLKSSEGDVRSNVSPMGQLLRNLHGLKSNDPGAFSNVTAIIADRLYELAQTESLDVADHLHRLAHRFSLASQSGNLSPLRPPDQNNVRGLHGPAAYVQQRNQDEGSLDLRLEVQTAIHDVLTPFVGATAGDQADVTDPRALDDGNARFGDLSVVS